MEKTKKNVTQTNIVPDKLTDDELEDLHVDDLKTEESNSAPFDQYGDLSNSETEENGWVLPMDQRREGLKDGDYIIQCHIIEARDLKGRGWNDMSDPVVIVEVMNQKKSTEIKQDCINAIFDQVLYFEFLSLDKQEMNEGKCKISVFDANNIMRNVLIGSYEFDLSRIYFSNQYHEIYKQWIGLSDTTDENEGIQGYLQVSIVVLGPNDEQKTHALIDENEETQNKNNLLSILLPPEIEQIPYLLSICIYECKDLCTSDIGFFSDACDPFAIVEFGSIKLHSKIKKGTNVNMLCELQIPVMEPLMCCIIKISFYDWNATKRNDRIASLSFDYNQIKNKDLYTFYLPKWYTLYGAPIGFQRGIARRMNQGFIEGTQYRGQVLLSLNITKQINRPKKCCVDISCLTNNLKPKYCSYLITCDLYEGSEIHKFNSLTNNNQMYIEICIGIYCAKSNKCNVKDGRCEWFNVIKSENNKYIGPIIMSDNIEHCPDIFIYLCCSSNDKRISYLRIPFQQIYDQQWKNPPKWYDLKEDKVIGVLNNEFPGSLLLAINAGRHDDLPLNGYLSESRPFVNCNNDISHANNEPIIALQKQEKLSSIGKLIVYIQQAQNLPSMDNNGKSDPYVQLKICDKIGNILTAKSTIISQTLNPKWYQQFIFNEISITETLKIKIFDKDKIKTDDLLGFVEILLTTQSNRPPGINFDVKNWFFINQKYPNSKIQIRLKFDFFTENEMKEKNNKKRNSWISNTLSSKRDILNNHQLRNTFGQPIKKSYQLRIHLYQARNLLATDSNGLCDPYVIIRCCGQITKSKIIYSSLDPQWYETLILNVLLPQPLTLAPNIHIQIFDYDKFSKDDIVGKFIMKLNDIINSKPKWYKLNDNNNKGEILMSFELISVSHNNTPNIPNLIPQSIDKYLQIVTLGLRGLNSIIGINKPYIKFNLNDRIFKTKKSNKPCSINPNFLQIFKIKIKLPIDSIFAPSLRITVKDSLFGGIIRRNIGNASISLQDLLQITNEYKKEEEFEEEESEEKKEVDIIIETRSETRNNIIIDVETDTEMKDENETCYLLNDNNNNNNNSDSESFDMNMKEDNDNNDDIPEYMINRQIIDNELEDEILMNPFLEIPIYCGQINSNMGINNYRKIGHFKGLIEITNTKKSSELNSKIGNIKNLLIPKNLFIRLYILRGIRLTPKDNNGLADPYLIIKFGKKYKISTRNNYIPNTLNPEFFESFEIQCTIPGVSKLTIEVWDYDGIGDDLIGYTEIDVENRWFANKWHKLQPLKPLEIRTLHSNSSSFAQGKLELWIDILNDIQIKKQPLLNIKPPPPSPYELRVIIWECKHVTIKDTITNMNDLYVTGFLDMDKYEGSCLKKQQTDLHFRSQKGFGSFNWRMKFNFNLPCKKPPRFRIQIWDKDYWSVNDSICEAYLSLSGIFKLCVQKKDKIVMKLNGKEKFWITDLKHPNFDGNQGKIKISIECMPANIAKQLVAGYGRSDPNMNPYLPPPDGRKKFSIFSPWKSLRNLLGDKIACKICIGLAISVIMSFLVLIGPTLISTLAAKAMTGF